MLKAFVLLPVVALGVATAACSGGPAVSGTWIRQSEVGSGDAYDCDDLGILQDTIQITASDAAGFGSSAQVPCSDGGFAMDVPDGARALAIVFERVTYDGNWSPNTVTVAGPIDSDVDLGHVQLQGAAPE